MTTKKKNKFPFDSLRDYAAALKEQGRFIEIEEMDQDRYEMTAFSYRLEDRLQDTAPAFLVRRTKINGRTYDMPVVGNLFNGFGSVAQCFGAPLDEMTESRSEMHALASRKILNCLGDDFRWKTIEPVVIDKAQAACKQVIYTGEDVDIFRFPWIKNNPADGGRFVSSGCAVMQDPELGRNVGTYRLHVKGPRKVGICLTQPSHGFQFVMRAAERGLERIPVSVAVGVDPLTFMMSGTRLADLGEDEFAIAGGFRGKPVELVKSETSDILVPAHAEIIIEGEIPIMEAEEDGPYGELFGYIGHKHQAFYIDIKAITCRTSPWVYNIWPGIGGAYLTLPWDVSHFARLKKIMRNLVKLYTPVETPSIVIISIDKKLPGEGIEAGMMVLGYRMVGFSKKIVIVVDRDIDPTDTARVMHAVGTRWQPHPASLLVKQSIHIPVEPSCREMFLSSKIVIDATRQLSSEGGPNMFPLDNRTVVEERAPEAFEIVDSKWAEYFNDK
ncbi:MAG: UbiD family decarboxylase [Deltaproteobacteria bacterium]|nr:UbiD family decarboxylase [Deltaproteobacteria bacterium]